VNATHFKTILERTQCIELFTWAPIVKPSVLRNDPSGKGHYGASRGSRTHQGYDLVCKHGEPVYAPVNGVITRKAYPYGSDQDWTGIEMKCSGVWEGFSIKIFYMEILPDLDKNVQAGQQIGTAQAISRKWGNHMKDHIHVEIRDRDGNTFDPEWLIMLHKRNEEPTV
jgi:murein DD-endopeptidase MepM/ murein hydrolase activator NlpD